LGITLELLQLKAANGITVKGFEELLRIIKNMLPEGNELPSTTYEAKRLFALLDWTYRRFTLVLMIVSSIVATNMRNWMFVLFVVQSDIRSGKIILVMSMGSLPRKKIPAKVMWFFPIILRLKRLFRNRAHAKLMRWHKEERK
jgi:hypothetical protein